MFTFTLLCHSLYLKPYNAQKTHVITIFINELIRPKNRCVPANMPKKIRVGRSENLFIFLQFFI